MREIKFRAWDSKRKRMWYGVECWDDLPLIICKQGKYVDWVLMQYTELKDRDGKDIYEGDIVEANIDGHICLAVIDYSNASFWMRVVDAPEGSDIKIGLRVGLIGDDNGIVKFVEVIGNVLEDWYFAVWVLRRRTTKTKEVESDG